jgi:hypothetical protein
MNKILITLTFSSVSVSSKPVSVLIIIFLDICMFVIIATVCRTCSNRWGCKPTTDIIKIGVPALFIDAPMMVFIAAVTDPETDDWFSQAADDVGEVLNPLNWF